MSQNRKYLKILSLAQFVVGIAVIVITCVSQLGSGLPSGGDVTVYLALAACFVLAGLTLAGSVMGIRGANRPSALGCHQVISILGCLVGIAAVVLTSGDDSPWMYVYALALIVDIEGGWLDTKVRKEIEARE